METIDILETGQSGHSVHTTGAAVLELSEIPLGNPDEIAQYALTREARITNVR